VAENLRVTKEEGKPTTVTGLAVPYGKRSEEIYGYTEIIRQGAFTRSIATAADLRVDVEHDRAILLARSKKGSAKFWDDSTGVWVEFQLPANDKGRNVEEDIRNGNLDAMSISFKHEPVTYEYSEDGDAVQREVIEAELTGVTLTAWPVYPQTADTVVLRSIEAWREEAKEAEQKAQEEAAAENDKLRRRLDLEEASL
jgi:HK97 family phage prohead protease